MNLAERTQVFLNKEGFDCGKADGIAGKNTLAAIEKLKKELKGETGIVSKIRESCRKAGFSSAQTAYVLATVDHETNGTFKPVREAYWLSEDWRKKNLRYYGDRGYYGRGFVQITWEVNYRKYSKILSNYFNIHIDLVDNPDLALVPEYAIVILVDGFKYGRFTGKKIADYINNDKVDFRNARRCINGLDRATHIAKLAKRYL